MARDFRGSMSAAWIASENRVAEPINPTACRQCGRFCTALQDGICRPCRGIHSHSKRIGPFSEADMEEYLSGYGWLYKKSMFLRAEWRAITDERIARHEVARVRMLRAAGRTEPEHVEPWRRQQPWYRRFQELLSES